MCGRQRGAPRNRRRALEQQKLARLAGERIEFFRLVAPAREDVGQKSCAKKTKQGETDTEVDGDHSSA